MLTGCIGGPFLLLGFYTAAIVPFHDPASGFKHKSPAYYAAFAKSCDSLLAQHLVGTNEFVEVPVTDASLPKIVRDVHPFKIRVSRGCVSILAGGTSHVLGYGINWQRQDEAKTNVWALSTSQESQTHLLYVVER